MICIKYNQVFIYLIRYSGAQIKYKREENRINLKKKKNNR